MVLIAIQIRVLTKRFRSATAVSSYRTSSAACPSRSPDSLSMAPFICLLDAPFATPSFICPSTSCCACCVLFRWRVSQLTNCTDRLSLRASENLASCFGFTLSFGVPLFTKANYPFFSAASVILCRNHLPPLRLTAVPGSSAQTQRPFSFRGGHAFKANQSFNVSRHFPLLPTIGHSRVGVDVAAAKADCPLHARWGLAPPIEAGAPRRPHCYGHTGATQRPCGNFFCGAFS